MVVTTPSIALFQNFARHYSKLKTAAKLLVLSEDKSITLLANLHGMLAIQFPLSSSKTEFLFGKVEYLRLILNRSYIVLEIL